MQIFYGLQRLSRIEALFPRINAYLHIYIPGFFARFVPETCQEIFDLLPGDQISPDDPCQWLKLANIKLAMKELFHRHYLAIPKKHVLSSEGAAFHLKERKLSEDQVLKETADGRVRLSATVADTAELRWWWRLSLH